MLLVVTVCEHHHDGLGGDGSSHVVQRVEGAFIAPVQVFDDDQQRLYGGEPHKELGEVVYQLALVLLGKLGP